MNISELIDTLQGIKSAHGDLPVWHWDEYDRDWEIDADDVDVVIDKGKAVKVSL